MKCQKLSAAFRNRLNLFKVSTTITPCAICLHRSFFFAKWTKSQTGQIYLFIAECDAREWEQVGTEPMPFVLCGPNDLPPFDWSLAIDTMPNLSRHWLLPLHSVRKTHVGGAYRKICNRWCDYSLSTFVLSTLWRVCVCVCKTKRRNETVEKFFLEKESRRPSGQ